MGIYRFSMTLGFITTVFLNSNSTADDSIFISGNSCPALIKEFNQICAPKKIKFNPLTPEKCRSTHSQQFKIDITECLEPHVISYLNKDFIYDGPNCWAGALFFHRAIAGYNEAGSDLFGYYLDSPACRKLEQDEQPQAGDVIRIRGFGPEGGINVDSHGFIYLTDRLALSKNGLSSYNHRLKKPIRYEIQNLDKVFKTYKVSQKDCQKAQNSALSDECEEYGTYYRCVSYRTFLNTGLSPDELSRKELTDDLNTLESLEKYFQKAFVEFDLTGITPTALSIISPSLFEMKERYRSELMQRWKKRGITINTRILSTEDNESWYFTDYLDQAIEQKKMDHLAWVLLTLYYRTDDAWFNLSSIQNILRERNHR